MSNTLFTLITSHAHLEEVTHDLLTSPPPFIALDTEFTRQTTYWPHLCLLQLKARNTIWLIDPLSENLKLDLLKPLLLDKKIPKIMHAASQDQECFRYLWKQPLPHVFDTQVAAMLTSPVQMPSYQALVETHLQITLPKTHQRFDWSKRPLPLETLRYAANDVSYLDALYHILTSTLKHMKRLPWMDQEMKEIARLKNDPLQNAFTKIRFWSQKIKTPQAFEALNYLAEWRETQAIDENKLRKDILPDDWLLSLAHAPQKAHKNAIKTFLTQHPCLAHTLHTLHQQPDHMCARPPCNKRLSEAQKTHLKQLKQEALQAAEHLRIHPTLLITQKQLSALARGQALYDVVHTPWRQHILKRYKSFKNTIGI